MVNEGGDILKHKYANLVGSKTVDKSVRELKPAERNNALKRVDAFLARITDPTDPKKMRFDQSKYQKMIPGIIERLAIKLTKEDGETDEAKVNSIARNILKGEMSRARDDGDTPHFKTLQSLTDEEILQRYRPLVFERANTQRQSLKTWLDFMNSPAALYETWFKYIAIRSLQKMGSLNEDYTGFNSRGDTTLSSFPDISPTALDRVYDEFLMQQKKRQTQTVNRGNNDYDFPDLYAQALLDEKQHSEAEKGTWKVYTNTPESLAELVRDFQGKDTALCLQHESWAHEYLNRGDIHVYMTPDGAGELTMPRVVVVTEGKGAAARVLQVKGVIGSQQVESQFLQTARDHFSSMPGGSEFETITADMQSLKLIDQKMKKSVPLSKAELLLLYEYERPIGSFHYEKDPRIKELQTRRNVHEDLAVMFDCAAEEVAYSPNDLSKPNIKVYYGPVFQDMFKLLPPTVEGRIFITFPQSPIFFNSISIGGRSAEELLKQISDSRADGKRMLVEPDARTMLQQSRIESEERTIEMVVITPDKLGLMKGGTYKEICERAHYLGLKLSPAEVGPLVRLRENNQKLWSSVYIGMDPVQIGKGTSHIFTIKAHEEGLMLGETEIDETRVYGIANEFVFVRDMAMQ